MKKTRLFAALSSLAVILAVSCVKETPAEVEENQAEAGFRNVTLTAGVETKVNSANEVMKWNKAAENLAVFGQIGDGMVKYQFTKPQSRSSDTSAEFTGTVSENAVLKYACYPYEADDAQCSCTSDGVFTFNLDPGQIYHTVNSVSGYPPLYGTVSGESIMMKSACAYLKVTLPKDNAGQTLQIFKNVKVNAANSCGVFTVDCSGDAPVISAGNADETTSTPKDNKSGALYIPIIPGTYDEITITVNYIDDLGYPAFVRKSSSTQTFECGKFYDCKEVSGAYVESVTTGSGSLQETTLSMDASAVIWKYSGITDSNYTAKFFYAEQGTEKGAAGWTEVAAEISGDTNQVALAASATVDASKTYQYYVQVSDGVKTVDGEVIVVTAKESKEIEFILNGNDGTFEYLEPVADYMMITDADGNPAFPSFVPSPKAAYSYKIYSDTEYGDVTSGSGLPSNMLGGTISKTVGSEVFSIVLNSTGSYYTYFNSLFCCQKNFKIELSCPEGYTVTKVTLEVAADKKCNWGIGSTASSADILAAKDYKNTSTDVSEEIEIAGAKKDTPYYLISGDSSNRLGSLVVTYEK